jgi:hypothetical protein
MIANRWRPSGWCTSGPVVGVAQGCEGGHRVILGLEFPLMSKEIHAMAAQELACTTGAGRCDSAQAASVT